MNIGIFDSGIGGLNLTAELIKKYNHNYFYYADNKNCPYGNKSFNFIKQNVYKAMDYFVKCGVDVVIIACNTVSTMLGEDIKKDYKFKVILVTPNFEFVKNYSKFLFIATNNTIKSVLNNSKNIASSLNLSLEQFYSKIIVKSTTNLAQFTESVAPCFYYNYSNIRYILKDIPINIPIMLGCTHYTYYQKYINSLGYKTYSEIENLCKISEILQKNNNLLSNLTIKVTNLQKISLFYNIIDKLL